MSSYTLQVTLDRTYDQTVAATRTALSDAGFGILAEIDVSETMLNKLGIDMPAEVILGACRPELAHRALSADASIAAFLPCNVVVRAVGADKTLVESIDPDTLVRLTDDPTVAAVAAEARQRLTRALAELATTTASPTGGSHAART